MSDKDEIHVLESREYQEDVDRVVNDPQIQQMAKELKNGISRDEVNPEDNDLMTAAYHEARYRGVEFRFIGTPWRAIQQILSDGT